MLLYCCFTPAHEVLYRQIFLPSVPEGFEIRASILGIEGPGDYLSGEFLRCIRAKLDLVVESIGANRGDTIIWSDVDIRIIELDAADLLDFLDRSGADILFQRESRRMKDVNTGFFVCRCSDSVLEFFKSVRAELEVRPSENEQMVVNRLLFGKCEMRNEKSGMEKPETEKRNSQISWGYLPFSFYARTHGWPPPARLSIYHANYTKGADAIGQKMAQFGEVERLLQGGWRERALSVVRRIPAKLRRLAAGPRAEEPGERDRRSF